MFICDFCDKEFRKRHHLNYHERNKVCLKHVCLCGESFPTKNSKNLHENSLECQKKLSSLETEVVSLKAKLETLEEHPQTINNQSNVTTNTINQNIVFPVCFGKEDINRVLEKVPNLFQELLKEPKKSLNHLIYNIHCNPELPEYHNVFISNMNKPYAYISDGSRFVVQPKQESIEKVIESKQHLLMNYLDDNSDTIKEKILNAFSDYICKLDNNGESNHRKKLEIEVDCMLINVKKIIEEERNSITV